MAALPKIGIDIGSASIKIVELVAAGTDKWRLMAAASVATAGAIVSDKTNVASVAALLAKLVRESGARSRRAVVALPEDKVASHLVELPFMADNEIEQALTWQVEQYIPMPIDQAVWSWQVVSKDQIANTMEVMIVAAPKPLVESYRQVIEAAGLEPLAFETELMATARSTVPANSPLTVVVDIGASGSDMGLVRGGVLMFARSVATAGEAFTRAIETTLGLDKAQAESYKNTYGFSTSQLEGKLLQAMKPVLAVIAAEIRKTIDFYVSKHAGEAVKSVVISGGVAALPDVVSALSANLGLEVVVATPLSRVQMDSAQQAAIKGNEPFYAVAVGLAQRND